MDKLLIIVAISVLFLSLNVNQAMAGGIFDVFFDIEVQTSSGDPVPGASCTISDPGFGIVVSGVTDSNGIFSGQIIGVMTGEVYDVMCTLGTLGASQSLTIGSGQRETVSLIFSPLVGGEFIPIEATSLILSGVHTFSWMIPVVLSTIGIGIIIVKKSESS